MDKRSTRSYEQEDTNDFTDNRMYHPQSDTNRLYISRKESGRRLISITDCIETEEQNHSQYLDHSGERERKRKRKKDTSNKRRNNSMVNILEKENYLKLRRH